MNADTSWHTDEFPELRSGPPWVMQEMIAAQPELAEQMLTAPSSSVPVIAREIASAVAAGRPVVATGCGTSEHAAHGIVSLLGGRISPQGRALLHAKPALSAVADPSGGLCLAISHDGGTRATALAAAAAKSAGARTAAITHDASASVAVGAEHVLTTPLHDDSWCHTVAYTSALLAGAALAGHLAELSADPATAGTLLRQAIAVDASPTAEQLADRRVVLCAGAGVDHISARELALKIAEGARLPTLAMELETVLHGQLAGHEPADALILVAITEHPEGRRLARRLEHVARAASAIGIPVAALLSSRYDAALPAELTPAGRLTVDLPNAALLDHDLAGLLAGAGVLQTLTLELAHARGTNPDLIRREEAAYRTAAEAGDAETDW